MGKLNNKALAQVKSVTKASNEKANVLVVKMIAVEKLLDYSKNNENIEDTSDLEISMRELGFTDPIEVTDFGSEGSDTYTIISGHRRKYAGIKVGIDKFPCIVKHFANEKDLHNYVLMANSQRDSAKDPLLFCKRYKMHEEYLKDLGYKGSIREEVAKRLGISVQQADRFNKFNNIILPIWDMVRDETVGMSSVMPMAKHTQEEQEEILNIFKQALTKDYSLTRELCNSIIKEYREGKKSFDEIINVKDTEDITEGVSHSYNNGVSVMPVNTEPTETKILTENRNSEVNYDYSHREDLSTDNSYTEERLTEDDMKAIELNNKIEEKEKEENIGIDSTEVKKPISEEEKKLITGVKLANSLAKIDSLLNDFYSFNTVSEAEGVMLSMSSVIKLLASEIERVADNYKIENYKTVMSDLAKEINSYLK